MEATSEDAKIPHWGVPPEHLVLADEEIHVWHVEKPNWADVRVLARQLSPRERWEMRSHPKPKEFAASRHLVRVLLGRYLGRDPSRLRFRRGPGGRLMLRGEGCPHFDYAAGAGRAVFAISASHPLALGVDSIPEDLDVSSRMASMPPRDASLLEFLTPENRARAVVGYQAERQALERLRLYLAGEGAAANGAAGSPGAVDGRVERVRIGRNYVAALAAEGWDWSPSFWRFDPVGGEEGTAPEQLPEVEAAPASNGAGATAGQGDGPAAQPDAPATQGHAVVAPAQSPPGPRPRGRAGGSKRRPWRSPLVVDDLRQRSLDGQCEVSARVCRRDDEELRLWYRFPEELAPAWLDGSPFLAGVVVWAMRHAQDVELEAPVSPRLRAHIDGIMAVYESMFPSQMRRVAVEAPTAEPPPANGRTGCFFSRGVDSWYAALSALEDDAQEPPLTHLVFSPDFLPTTRWTQERIEAKTRATLEAAQRTGCQVIEVHTNQKRDFRGAQLMGSALAMGFSRMLIPSGSMHGEIVPAGTHPALDWRFSTERTEIVHYGDANRLDKVARIARSDDALATLNVCRLNKGVGDENCGRCEKCLRTMLELYVVGALDRAPVFQRPLEPARVAEMRKLLGVNRHIWVEVLHALGDSPADREMAAAVRLVIASSDLRTACHELREVLTDPALGDVREDLPIAVQRAKEMGGYAWREIHADPQTPQRGLGWRVARSVLHRTSGKDGHLAVESEAEVQEPAG